MIKAKTTTGDIFLGLTEENVKRMKDGQPIKVDLRELGLGTRLIYIAYGKDEAAIAEQLGVDYSQSADGKPKH